MPLKLKLNSLECTAVWKYNFPQNTGGKCQICRRSIMAPSYEDINSHNLVSRISVGKCGHAYHTECIKTYCKKNISCPIDFTHWNTLKEIEGPNLVSVKPKVQEKEKEKEISPSISKDENTNSFINDLSTTLLGSFSGLPKNPPKLVGKNIFK